MTTEVILTFAAVYFLWFFAYTVHYLITEVAWAEEE